MDLDPDPSVAWDQVVAAAIEMRARSSRARPRDVRQDDRGKGLHVVAPLERRISWDDLKAFAKGVGERLVADFRIATRPTL
jgi:bifunctional non-homologous end joining protein LigD